MTRPSRFRLTALLQLLFVALAVLLASCTSAPAETGMAGRVVAVKDGDTLELLTADKRLVTIRLAEIDAPEKGQPYGQRAKQALSDLCFGKEVTARTVVIDRYGRTVARIYQDGTDVNAELVREGAVWLYRKHLKDQSLIPIEAEARAAKRGLWSLAEREQVPPWEWRRAR
ncbi:MAG: thermonuclease family protein [Rubrivivax sp.]|nr:thermonuclease family protein [Rubrivivax sp.]